jgi:uncharacterized membrane protein
MQARAKLLGHPVHQMLIVFPLGLLTTSLIFDVIGALASKQQMFLVSYWTLAAGIFGGVVAAFFGWIDWTAIPKGTRARRVGLAHGLGNAIALIVFLQSFVVRMASPLDPNRLAVALSVVGVAISMVTGWLGGELVDRLGVGVDEGANPDAPSSLREPTI